MTTQTVSHTGISADHGLGKFVEMLRARFARYRTYRTTLNEMSKLSDRELTDLGLDRTRISSLAWEASAPK